MAVDKLVDSSQLDSDLTSVANAIRTKGGTSASLAFPAGFVSAIGDIPSGSQEWFLGKTATIYGAFNYNDSNNIPDLPTVITIDAPYCYDASRAFMQTSTSNMWSTGIEEVSFHTEVPCQCLRFLEYNTSIKKVTFVDGITIYGSMQEFTWNNTTIESFIGEITFSSVSTFLGAFSKATALKDITIAANTIKLDIEFGSAVLTTASLISIANGLDGTVTGKTLKHHATAKTNCGTIMGTNNSGTFIADAQGSMSLATFISTVKGWTLA